MPPVDELGDDPAGRLAGVAHAEHLAYLGQGQPDRLRRPDEGDPIDGVVGIRPIARRGPARRGQEPELLVVANRGGGEARPTGEYSDAHGWMIDLLTLKGT